MNRFYTYFLLALLLSGCSQPVKSMQEGEEDFTRYVNPNIGSIHSRWFFYTPGAVPFGMAKLAPSTNGSYGNPAGWEAVGYEDGHASIEGFACFHEFQVGGVMLMPVTGEVKTKPGRLETPQDGYRSTFDKESEIATSGYYRVHLKDYNVVAELTATKRVGFQRYTFPRSDSAYIIFDIGNQLGESGKVKDASIHRLDDRTIVGYVTTQPEYVKKYQPDGDVRMFFHAELSKPTTDCLIFRRGEAYRKGTTIEGVGSTMAVGFETGENEQVTVKIGLSYTSIENAKLNLKREAGNLDFDHAREHAHVSWKKMLGRIKVSGGHADDKVKFYTGLYHALLGRGLASDVNGAYPKHEGGIGHIGLDIDGEPLYHHYNTDAVWGAFWNLSQLWALAYPDYYTEWISSQLLVYKDSGWLGDGIANSRYVSGVGTNFTGLLIAAAYNCGIRDFNVPLAYEAALKNEMVGKNRPLGAGKPDVDFFVEKGYAPYAPELENKTVPEGWMFGASHTLEYAFSSFAIAQFAKQLGREDDHKQLSKLAENWKNIFDSTSKLMHPRLTDGSFIPDFDPLQPWVGFQEGNAVQYTFYVPHHIEQLIELVGKETFNNRLDSIFTLSRENIFGGGREVNAFSGLQALYNHGNQPSLHISWLFNFSGKPWLTQKWSRAICNEFYGTDGLHGYGYGQDEDQGQLGTWYIMAAMGLFDVKGLTEKDPRMQLGSPLFDKIEISLDNTYYEGKVFVIETENNSKENQYIQEIFLNGKKNQSVFIPFEDIAKGGKIKLVMGNHPNTALNN